MPKQIPRFWKKKLEPLTLDFSNEKHGMFIFEAKPSHDPSVIDIVALHGLNGHYKDTWSSRSPAGEPVNWLKDFLPDRVPTARIMSFGYDSALQFSKSVSDVYTFAEQLLEALIAHRTSRVEETRPLVFICHSLGGIVFKQALNRAHEKERYQRILESVSGVVFFGTPHRGSDLASWSSVLSKILSAATLGTSTNKQLSKDLQSGSDSKTLENITKAFVDRGKSLEIYSFFETDKMDYMNCRVVEEASATLSWPNETTVGIGGDHRSICRFSTQDGPRFKVVSNALQKLSERRFSVRNFSEADDERFYLSLRNSDYEGHKNRNATAVQGTCRWILTHKIYEKWISAQHSSLIWLSADPGCGKSVLTSFLVNENIPCWTESLVKNVCYFFFKADNEEQSNAVQALCAILHQIYTAQPCLITHATRNLQIPGHNIERLDTMWKILVDTIEDERTNDTLCFIDALDECDLLSQRPLMAHISGYFAKCQRDEPRRGQQHSRLRRACLKMFITSRPENYIKTAFDKTYVPDTNQNVKNSTLPQPMQAYDLASQEVISMTRLRGEDETDAISSDIELVVKSAIKDLISEGLPATILSGLEAQLITRADRTFLWTTLMIKLLKERVEEGASQRELYAILRESHDLDSIYSALLAGRKSTVQVRKMLSIILAATRPLELGELSIAIAITPDCDTFASSSVRRMPSSRNFEDLELDLVYPFENYLKSLCGHFIRIIRGRVYLVHETAREFLLARRRGSSKAETGAPWRHSFSMRISNALLLELCVSYLYYFAKESKPNEFDRSKVIYDFLDYAANNWTSHFKKVSSAIPVSQINYYHGLCHPAFLGFQVWICRRGGNLNQTIRMQLGLTDIQKQDFLVETLLSDDDSRFTSAGLVPNSEQYLSSNPTSQSNHYFPVQSDKNGLVFLNFQEAFKPVD